MKNMKLLDLQTGKYLELGTDWGYYGTHISLETKQQEAILRHLQFDRDCMNELFKKNEFSIKYDLGVSAMQATDNILRQVTDCMIMQGTIAKQCSNSIIDDIAGKVGAVVYGGRYVLLQFANNKTVGDVIKHNPKRTQFDQLPKIYHTNEEVCEILSKDVVLCEEMGYSSEYVDPDYHSKIIGNIFEEYSKQLRNEPNKFEELMERNGRWVVLW